MRQGRHALFALFLLLTVGLVPAAEEWTRFRGPDGAGVAEAPGIPVQWSAADCDWTVKLPAAGHASPVGWHDQLFIFSGDASGKRILQCLRLQDGGEAWRKEYDSPTHSMHKMNGYGTATPAVDAERVYATWASPQQVILVALDHAGQEVWKREDLGTFVAQHGSGSSPIVLDGLVLLANETESGDSFLIALDAKTGRTVWKQARQTTKASYATPCVFQPAGEPAQVIFAGKDYGFSALDPKTGNTIWDLKDVFPLRVVSSPFISGGLIFGSCGEGGRGLVVVAARPGTRAEPASAQVAYELKQTVPYVPTAIAYRDLLFLCSEAGVIQCVRTATGEQLWRERLSDRFFASPVCINGKLYLVTDKGDVLVIPAAEKYELLARNPLGEGSYATPAVIGGRLILRTFTQLLSIGGKAKP